MAEPFIGEVRIFAFDYAPRGWAFCDGALQKIQQNPALFSLLGTMYGGDGVNTFGLPNLQGRVAAGFGPSFPQGQSGGEASHTVVQGEMPPVHQHLAMGVATTAGSNLPAGNVLAKTSGNNIYAVPTTPQSISSGTIAPAGGQPHENMSPYQVVSFCIALQGIFPPRS